MNKNVETDETRQRFKLDCEGEIEDANEDGDSIKQFGNVHSQSFCLVRITTEILPD